MNKQDFNEGLLGFLDASPTPFHATQNMSMMLENAGFVRLFEEQKWEIGEGIYAIASFDTSLFLLDILF